MGEGDLVQAHERLVSVHRLVKNPATSDWMKWRYSTHLFASLGDLWLARGDPSKATEFASQCLALATPMSSRKYLVRGGRLTGEIALAQRRWDEAEQALRQALAVAQAIGNPTQLWKTHRALGRFFAEAKRPEEAHRAHQAARSVTDKVSAELTNPGLRGAWASAPFLRQGLEFADPD
jgi:hypothetical protein